jgi:hypothetical protein
MPRKIKVDRLIDLVGSEYTRELLDILCINLGNKMTVFPGDGSMHAIGEYHDHVSDIWRRVDAFLMPISSRYSVFWTFSEEFGLSDECIVERLEFGVDDLKAWLGVTCRQYGSTLGEARILSADF